MRVLFGCLCVGAVLACADATGAPNLDLLIGTWQAPTAPLEPRGSLDRILVERRIVPS